MQSPDQTRWNSVLTLDSARKRIAGSEEELAAAIRRGADLRIYTEFRNNEHLDTASDSDELVQEVSEFRVTYLLDDRWTAGIMSLRMPILPPDGFGPQASLSFFLYNQDGQQAIARPHFDGQDRDGQCGPAELDDFSAMPKYHQLDNWDVSTNAPSHNFVYDFETFRYCVRDDWREVLSHTSDGSVLSGSLDALTEEFARGVEIKVAIRGLCDDVEGTTSDPLAHELFVQTGPSYFHTEQKLFVAGTHPVIRVQPAIPLQYASGNWDFGSLMVRTDGLVARWLADPYTMKFTKSESRHDVRWFVR